MTNSDTSLLQWRNACLRVLFLLRHASSQPGKERRHFLLLLTVFALDIEQINLLLRIFKHLEQNPANPLKLLQVTLFNIKLLFIVRSKQLLEQVPQHSHFHLIVLQVLESLKCVQFALKFLDLVCEQGLGLELLDSGSEGFVFGLLFFEFVEKEEFDLGEMFDFEFLSYDRHIIERVLMVGFAALKFKRIFFLFLFAGLFKVFFIFLVSVIDIGVEPEPKQLISGKREGTADTVSEIDFR